MVLFPTGLDAFPEAADLTSDTLATVPHSTLHGDLGDAVAALEAKVGIDSSDVTTSLDYLVAQLDANPLLGNWAGQTVYGNNTSSSAPPVAMSPDDFLAWLGLGPISSPVPIADGGTGAATQQLGLNALAGAVTNHTVLAGDGTNITARALTTADLPTGTGSTNVVIGGVITGAGPIGDAAHTPVLTYNNAGQLTTVTNTAIALAGSAITSGTVAIGRLPTGTNSSSVLAGGVITAAGPQGDASHTQVLTFNAGGQLTAVTNTAIGSLDVAAITTGTLGVARGGLGVASPTAHAVLVGEGSSAVTPITVGSNGQLLIGQTSADPAFTTVTGDVTITNGGVTSIASQAVTASKVGQLPYCFLLAGTKFALPSGTYTPIPLDNSLGAASFDSNSFWPGLTGTTTIGSGSNTNVLPQATINLAAGGIAAAGLPSAGYITVNGPPGASTLTIIKYTGVSAGTGTGGQDQLTGCTLGTGTLATSQVVKPANVDLTINQQGLYLATVCCEFPASNTTGLLGVRLNQAGTGVGTNEVPNPNAAIRVSVGGQPAFSSTGTGKIRAEVFQSSGSAITIPLDGFQGPSIGLAFLSHN